MTPPLVNTWEAVEIALRDILDEDEAVDAAFALKESGLLVLRSHVVRIKELASDPFVSEVVALRACLLEAYEALGFPGPEDSPLRETARAIIASNWWPGHVQVHRAYHAELQARTWRAEAALERLQEAVQHVVADSPGTPDSVKAYLCKALAIARNDEVEGDDGYVHGSVA